MSFFENLTILSYETQMSENGDTPPPPLKIQLCLLKHASYTSLNVFISEQTQNIIELCMLDYFRSSIEICI